MYPGNNLLNLRDALGLQVYFIVAYLATKVNFCVKMSTKEKKEKRLLQQL